MRTWHDNFLTYEGCFLWTAWDETQSVILGQRFFKWRAKLLLDKYSETLNFR